MSPPRSSAFSPSRTSSALRPRLTARFLCSPISSSPCSAISASMPPMVRSEAAGAEARDSSCSISRNPPDEERLAVLEELETRAVTFGPAMRMAWLRVG